MLFKRLWFLNDFRNIVIVILILCILVASYDILFNNTAYASGNKPNQDTISSNDIGRIFYIAIEQVFPGSSDENNLELINLRGIYTSLYKNIFFIDFKNPITFIESQFPALALVSNKPQGLYLAEKNKAANNSENKITDRSEDEEASEAAITSINSTEDPDDIGELKGGIYLSESQQIVDSLMGNFQLNLAPSEMPEKITFEEDKPQILIYHTHGTESYKPASEGNYHSLRREYSVITIGEIIKKQLEDRGFEVIHDTTYHDYPSYNGSYGRSIATAKEILKEYPSIKVVLDVHRDGYDHIDTNPNRDRLIKNNQILINGETASKFQLVIGSETPNKVEVTKFAQLIKTVSDSIYPELSKPILVKPYGRFNQYLTNHYALLEVGSNANTIEEAKKSAVYLAEVLANTLDNLRE